MKFPPKNKNIIQYLGQVIELAEYGEFTDKFIWHSMNRFQIPLIDDVSWDSRNDTESKLPKPLSVTGTFRLPGFMKFDVHFDSLILK